MARFTLLAAIFAGLVCLIDHSAVLAMPNAIQAPSDASQIPNFPGPGDIPKPPGMLHSRVARQAPPEIPGQDQFPPPPPPPPQMSQMPQMRSRRNARTSIEMANMLPALEPISYISLAREKRAAKGTGGKLPSKAG
ncbi:formin-like protein 1 [Anopheles maculipalpis]|uniref:formin-like protein 1 n=1 Tax=Anopheles maculipalpis TaxID=1496333 RepID=UPI002158E840|nr:formin-like protein 1 [Anopheles maculipalpis]